jgi:signal transduction histidine kinase
MSIPLHVLVIEDSEDDTLLLMHTLRQSGYEPLFERVETYESMKRALESQKWDVVIADYLMPQFSAPAALELFKEKNLDIPFIIVSGAIGEEAAVSAMKAGAHDYIMKSNRARFAPAIARELREAQVRQKRKQAEEEKKKIEAQLLQAQRMEAIGRLTGGVAHDFNNILTVIRGYADMAIKQAKPGTQLSADLKEIEVASERAMNLTRQLLLFSRRQPMKFAPIDLNKTIENLLGMLHRIIGEDIEVRYDLASESLFICADQNSIEQMMMNLAVNARDAMHEGGIISIKTEKVTIGEKSCHDVSDARPGRFVKFSVTDTGTGMDPEILKHIFEPFFSTKNFGKGSGLGLSVVYGIIQQHKGWIQVHSEVGQGSTFEVYLPAVDELSEGTEEKKVTPNIYQGKGERILIIEDEDSVRHFAQRALSMNGYTVFTASDEKEAVEVFEKEKGAFRLIFSDVVLPTTNGIKLTDKFLSINPNLRILLTSGYTDQKSQWKKIKKNGYPFLQKPYTLNVLLKAVGDCISNK